MSSGIQAIVDINQTAARFKSSIVLRINQLEIHGPDETEAIAAMLEVFKKHHLPVELI